MELTRRVVVAIVTHNSAEVIGTCLEGFRYLSKMPGVTSEVLVADNDSSDDTARIVQDTGERFPELPLKLVTSPDNVGWGAGNNLAINSSTAEPDYVLVCNPDAGIDELGLQTLISSLEAASPRAAIAVPFLRTGRGAVLAANPEWNLAKFVFWDLVGNGRPYRKFQRRYSKRVGMFEVKSAYASGALALFAYPALKQAGFFDERIFLFHDDIDISRSILRTGRSLVGNSAAVGYHEGGRGSRISQTSVAGTTPATLAMESELVFVEKWHGKRWAYLLARYRWHVFYQLQRLGFVVTRRTGFDIEPFRAPARRYLDARSHGRRKRGIG